MKSKACLQGSPQVSLEHPAALAAASSGVSILKEIGRVSEFVAI